jgi:hypothetical protein
MASSSKRCRRKGSSYLSSATCFLTVAQRQRARCIAERRCPQPQGRNGNAGYYGLTPDQRKKILVGAFTESVRQLGGYQYVAETTVLRPLSDRPLYCLCYATRHEKGIEVFRDCQVAALNAQSKTRATGKVRHFASSSGQTELFDSLHDMGPDDTVAYLERERRKAEGAIRELAPKSPDHIAYRKLWPLVLSRHVVRLKDVNDICANRAAGEKRNVG